MKERIKARIYKELRPIKKYFNPKLKTSKQKERGKNPNNKLNSKAIIKIEKWKEEKITKERVENKQTKRKNKKRLLKHIYNKSGVNRNISYI